MLQVWRKLSEELQTLAGFPAAALPAYETAMGEFHLCWTISEMQDAARAGWAPSAEEGFKAWKPAETEDE